MLLVYSHFKVPVLMPDTALNLWRIRMFSISPLYKLFSELCNLNDSLYSPQELGSVLKGMGVAVTEEKLAVTKFL
jgi:hypothetical protein